MNPGTSNRKSGTRIINLLVPMAFRSSQKVIAEMVYELRKVGTSAADLKSLHRKRRNEPRDFKSKSGTRIINLLVPMAFFTRAHFPKFAEGDRGTGVRTSESGH